jgi:hypothetical protein
MTEEQKKSALQKKLFAIDELMTLACAQHGYHPVIIQDKKDEFRFYMPANKFCCPEFHAIALEYYRDFLKR